MDEGAHYTSFNELPCIRNKLCDQKLNCIRIGISLWWCNSFTSPKTPIHVTCDAIKPHKRAIFVMYTSATHHMYKCPNILLWHYTYKWLISSVVVNQHYSVTCSPQMLPNRSKLWGPILGWIWFPLRQLCADKTSEFLMVPTGRSERSVGLL